MPGMDRRFGAFIDWSSGAMHLNVSSGSCTSSVHRIQPCSSVHGSGTPIDLCRRTLQLVFIGRKDEARKHVEASGLLELPMDDGGPTFIQLPSYWNWLKISVCGISKTVALLVGKKGKEACQFSWQPCPSIESSSVVLLP